MTDEVYVLVVFLAWLSLVGNPHVVETSMGVVIGVLAGWWIGRFLPAAKDQ
jgi:membrane protein YqaA with SNARE-associated domain